MMANGHHTVVGQDSDGRFVVMTNAHVVKEAVRCGWPSVAGFKLACDFARYTTSAGGQLLAFGLLRSDLGKVTRSMSSCTMPRLFREAQALASWI